MSASERAFDKVIARRLSLDRYSDTLARDLRTTVSPRVRQSILLILSSLLSKTRITRRDIQWALADFRHALRGVSAVIRERLLSALKEIIATELRFGQRVVTESIGTAAVPHVPEEIEEELVDESRLQDQLNTLQAALGAAFTAFLARIRAQALHESLKQGLDDVLSGGLSQHMREEISRSLLRGETSGVGKIITQAEQALQRLVQTETFDRANAALSAAYAAQERLIQGEYFSAILDQRTCQQCAALDGMIFWYEKPPQGYDDRNRPISEQPRLPLHPNCRCVYVPILDTIPRRVSYAEFFEKLPEEQKLTILGRGKYELYTRGKLNIYDLGTYEGIVTLRELRGD